MAKVDISTAFEKIFAHTINHICFGENYNDDKFMFYYYDSLKDSWHEKKVTMREAVHNLTKLVIKMYQTKLTHPITGPANLLF